MTFKKEFALAWDNPKKNLAWENLKKKRPGPTRSGNVSK